MVPGYIVTRISINDRERFREYAKAAFPTMEANGCEVLVDDGDTELLEGDWARERTVILKWPSKQAALDWYHSPEYQAVIGMRHESTDCDIVVVGGVGG
jgi:uncharacterized protein (DUF1330 family)